MIVEANGDVIYGESWLMTKLSPVGHATFSNYLGDGRDLVVTVPSITSTARVKIEFGGSSCDKPATPNPSTPSHQT